MHQMLLERRNKNTYSLRVGISIVFKIFSNFLFQGRVGLTPWAISDVLHILPVTQGTRIYMV
jgi:hypothetical protein